MVRLKVAKEQDYLNSIRFMINQGSERLPNLQDLSEIEKNMYSIFFVSWLYVIITGEKKINSKVLGWCSLL
jgi:hypothetical protein